jgi:hypothetical protein
MGGQESFERVHEEKRGWIDIATLSDGILAEKPEQGNLLGINFEVFWWASAEIFGGAT